MEDPKYTVPKPHKVRAIRIPADGSRPHLITLDTMVTDPTPIPQIHDYTTLLSYLEAEDKPRHVPNVMAFWSRQGWDRRNNTLLYYKNDKMKSLEGIYYILMTFGRENMLVNKHLPNGGEDYYGDAFVLGKSPPLRTDTTQVQHVIDYLYLLRQDHLFPVFKDVKDELEGTDIVEAVARALWCPAGSFKG